MQEVAIEEEAGKVCGVFMFFENAEHFEIWREREQHIRSDLKSQVWSRAIPAGTVAKVASKLITTITLISMRIADDMKKAKVESDASVSQQASS